LRAYEGAIERAFGSQVDYGSIIKTFSHSDLAEQRRHSPPEVISVKRVPVAGAPVVDLTSTSYVEKQNHTLRMHCRRLSRLTNAFSKKFETSRQRSHSITGITTSSNSTVPFDARQRWQQASQIPHGLFAIW
jgi:hypothetical protein